jgi:hypothetical protein
MKFRITIFRCVFLCLFVLLAHAVVTPEALQQVVLKLRDEVVSAQILESTPYESLLNQEKIRGLFPSYVHLNFHGGNSSSHNLTS